MNRLRAYLLLLLLAIVLIGCASTVPLPTTLNIVPPSPDISPEIAAYSGIWEGKWYGYLESILVVEKIDFNKAEVIFSTGLSEGYSPRYSYYTAQVYPDSIGWIAPDGSKIIFKMDKGLNKIYGTIIEKKTGAKILGYFHRRTIEELGE